MSPRTFDWWPFSENVTSPFSCGVLDQRKVIEARERGVEEIDLEYFTLIRTGAGGLTCKGAALNRYGRFTSGNRQAVAGLPQPI
ncbi:hypothetical protein LX32DRAFT_645971 [Colletotrichum zoysiae]|uniref:Uncharacterized protein n=1 Tax=Colletotrichum zoysiae TaxID=1216348 RepID=A0AAD9H4Y5_9PEZI|nr:hypothetical protein LX32DRAFT_645971 [Colletotrichum zoysiae]